MKILHVSAGGRGERIAAFIAGIPAYCPKYLLSIPCPGETILGEIVRVAEPYFDRVDVWTSDATRSVIAQALQAHPRTEVRVDEKMSGPMGPVVRNLLERGERTYGCAGDFYADFCWEEFERFHEAHGRPISILVARSVPAPSGARFLVNDGCVTGWERVKQTTAEDRINIGCYIVDPVKEVTDVLQVFTKHKEDPFFDAFVPRGLVAGYDPATIGYNVNVREVYEELKRALGA